MNPEDVKTRDDIGLLLNSMDLTGVGAEIGVEYGQNAEVILDKSKISMLMLVDAWAYLPGHDPRGFFIGYEDWENVYQACVDRLMRFCDRTKLMRMSSEEASRVVDDESLDFVYIDANHMSPWVDYDLGLWWPKVKSGGLFSGHDYGNRIEYDVLKTEVFRCDVKTAVDKFALEHSLSLSITTSDEIPSWMVIK